MLQLCIDVLQRAKKQPKPSRKLVRFATVEPYRENRFPNRVGIDNFNLHVPRLCGIMAHKQNQSPSVAQAWKLTFWTGTRKPNYYPTPRLV
jgi:hypothetical protein